MKEKIQKGYEKSLRELILKFMVESESLNNKQKDLLFIKLNSQWIEVCRKAQIKYKHELNREAFTHNVKRNIAKPNKIISFFKKLFGK